MRLLLWVGTHLILEHTVCDVTGIFTVYFGLGFFFTNLFEDVALHVKCFGLRVITQD